MLENIKGLKIQGRCFSEETDLILFPNPNDRISIVYGKNGSGKSTISEGLSSIAENIFPTDLTASLLNTENHTVALSEDSKLFVFNEKYIDENVKIDDDGLSTIILLGGQVNVQADIDKKLAEVTTLQAESEFIQSEYNKYLEDKNPLNPQYHWIRLASILKQAGGWAEVDSKIKNNRRNSSVTDDVITEICSLSTKLTSAELQKKFDDTQALLDKVSDITTAYPDEIKLLTFDNKWEQSVIELLSTKLEEPILSDREKMILDIIQNGGQTTVENARHKFSSKETSVCPYCYQEVSETYKQGLIDSIDKVLNKEVDAHKAALNAISIPNLSINLTSYEELDPKLFKSIVTQLKECQTLIEIYKTAIETKLNNVYTPVQLSNQDLSAAITHLNEFLEKLEDKRKEFNIAASKKGALVKELISINKLIAHLQTSQVYKDYLKQTEEKKKMAEKLSKKLKALKDAQETLRNLKQRKSDIGLAINNINNALDYVFFSQGRLSIELKNDKYYLKSNGKNVKPKSVSLGERNIIALCYFFTQILANQEISRLYQNEAFIVVDDPISSFDFENKVGIASFLRLQINRIINGNSKSKVLILSHDLETVFNLRKAMDEICQSTKGIAGITPSSYIVLELNNLLLKPLIKNHNEYSALIKKVYHYANGDSNNDSATIGNIMRRVLEAFSTFNYQKNIEKVSCDKNVLKALGKHSTYFENLMYRLVLHGESHYEEQVYSIHDGNNFYEFISETEKQKTAKNILCFMYLLNPYHVIAYLQEESNSINNVKSWMKDIPENDSFEISKTVVKRIVPLYDLPLSAGVGNESFDGIPFEEYETENLLCDFALKISGDSMEPNIKDKSIVLIKRQRVIDEGKVGAFYLNDKVYCKYLSYDNGKTLLCSYNDKYAPIEVKEYDTLFVYGEVIAII